MRNEAVEVSVTRHASASPEFLFQLLDDASTWPNWSIIGSVHFERPADATAQLVGARRTFTTGLLRMQEEITRRVPNEVIEYALMSGLPLYHYKGRIELEPSGAGTAITWSTTFRTRSWASRWLWKPVIASIISRVSRDAVREAEARCQR